MTIAQPNFILAAALAYAAKGWRVFPCDPHPDKPRSKRPLVTTDKDETGKGIEGTGWPKKATTDEATIRAWWRRWPDALIGCSPGGAGAFVVDLDPKGESVETVEVRLIDAIGHMFPFGPRTITQSGGRHLWFRRPAGGPYGNDTPGLVNIDIRCDNGYVILPPSRLRNGNAYAWDGEFNAADLPEVPQALLDLIAQNRGSKRAAPIAGARAPLSVVAAPVSDAARTARERYGQVALANIGTEAARTSAQRGTAVFAAAAAAGRLVAAGAVSERQALAVIMDASDANGLTATDGAANVEREARRGLLTGFSDADDVIRRVREIEADAERRAARPHRESGERPPAPPIEAYEEAFEPQARRGEPAPAVTAQGSASPVEPSDMDEEGCDAPTRKDAAFSHDAVKECARLDHSDTDNGQRLRAHFGRDLRVMQRKGVRNQEFLVWAGTHWDLDTGQDKAFAIAQEIGGLIGLEADHLAHTPQEALTIATAATAKDELADLEIAIERLDAEVKKLGKAKAIDVAAVEAAELKLKKARGRRHLLEEQIEAVAAARAALDRRQVARRKFGISSKNESRLKAMLSCAAPHLTVRPDQFNADPMRLATLSHTLVFRRDAGPANPASDGAYVDALKGHDPRDLITFVVPIEYDPDASAPKWLSFMERFLPVPAVRRFFQVYAGLGLLGETVQKLVFNYGDGANGKSIAMQTIFNVLGGLAVNLEPESIVGTDTRSGGAASPDLIKLFGKRFLRISELPKNEPLKEALVKKITGGGEEMSVRGLFQGMIDFIPIFTAMMSGNGYPRIDGTDHGIWRRIAVVLWPVKIAEDEQRPFNEVIDGFRPEYAGILNWLIEGAKIYLAEGLVVPAEIKSATDDYRAEMDPTSAFVAACVEKCDGYSEKARVMYEAYVSWAMANGAAPIKETRFGLIMKGKFRRDDARTRSYMDCRLHDVPKRPMQGGAHHVDPAAPSDDWPDYDSDYR